MSFVSVFVRKIAAYNHTRRALFAFEIRLLVGTFYFSFSCYNREICLSRLLDSLRSSLM